AVVDRLRWQKTDDLDVTARVGLQRLKLFFIEHHQATLSGAISAAGFGMAHGSASVGMDHRLPDRRAIFLMQDAKMYAAILYRRIELDRHFHPLDSNDAVPPRACRHQPFSR